MTVLELIAALQKEDPAALVVLSRDAEGNGYSPVADIHPGLYVPESTWSGTFYSGLEEKDIPSVESRVAAVGLWPVN